MKSQRCIRRLAALPLLLVALSACESDFARAFTWPSPPVGVAGSMAPVVARGETPASPEKAASAETPDSRMAEMVAKLPLGTPVDAAPAAAEDAHTPKLVVLEEYDAATGERCRRFAYFAADTEQGLIQTACRLSDKGAWVALRALSHDTMSPLASLPAFNAAVLVQDGQ